MFSESQLYLRSEQKMKRGRPGEQQQQPDLEGHQASARFVFDLEKVCIPGAIMGPGDFGYQQ